MNGSILNTIKALLGLSEDDTSFDMDIIIHINTALMTLAQLGIGPVEGFSIDGVDQTWLDFFGNAQVAAAKTYVYLSVKLIFDPAGTGFVLEAYNRQLTELAWRLSVHADSQEIL